MFLLDTNACIAARKKQPAFLANMRRHSPDDLFISVITLAEIHYGLARLEPDTAQRKWEEWKILLGPFTVVELTEACAVIWGRLRYEMRHQPISERDLMISSIALANGMVVVTHNMDEFSRVPQLLSEDWE